MVGLAKRYPSRLIEQACAQAMQENVRSYLSIKTLTERLLAQALAAAETPPEEPPGLAQQHPLIRDGGDYADLFAQAAHASAETSTNQEPTTP